MLVCLEWPNATFMAFQHELPGIQTVGVVCQFADYLSTFGNLLGGIRPSRSVDQVFRMFKTHFRPWPVKEVLKPLHRQAP